MNNLFRKPVAIDRGVYAMSMEDGRNAEITMYGEIVAQRPTNWRTGQPVEGDYIVRDEFLEDLEKVAGARTLTIHMDSLGGDVGVSVLIHNRLRELAKNGTALTCIVDGVAMSGGSLIMRACDTVWVNPSSLIMIHKCWVFIFGSYNADELRKEAAACDAWDRAQVSIYKRRCGLDEAEITRMMAETTYMTGQEAIDRGFADALLEDAEPLNIAASADGKSLYVRGREFHLCPGLFAPDRIPTAGPGVEAPVKNIPPAAAGEGGNRMEGTTKAPALQGDSQAPSALEQVAAERQRLRDIDAIAALYDPALVQEAKYGESPCTAQELAYKAAVQSAAQAEGQGRAFLAAVQADEKAAGEVTAAPVHEPEAFESRTPEQRMSEARAEIHALFGSKKEG